ncbi:DUF998 domain-containing protein [Jannaschia sp. R86511]|uniref:DUF998 domain-containing protein n=1 Tax=Jannaschia sp. R86511 TaxID=3093853 RepID=UPI0036D20CA8
MSRLPLLAPLGGALFTVAWLVLGAVSPGYQLFDLVVEPYSSVSQPVSGLGLGVTGVWMNTAFVVGGLLVLAGAVGVRRALPRGRAVSAGLALSALTGLGMVVDGLFTLESVLIHLVGFLLAIPAAGVGFVVLGAALLPTSPGLARVLLGAGPVSLALFVWFMVVFDPYTAGDGSGYAGVLQRVLITLLLATWGVLGVAARRRAPEPVGETEEARAVR